MAAGDLTTLATAYGWIGAPSGSDDATLARVISAISGRIQQFLSYQIASASYTRSFNGRGSRILTLPDRPVTAVASLTIDGIVIPQSVNRSAGFLFDERSIGLVGFYQFCRGFQNVSAAYTAGYSATPPDIEQACLDWLKAVYATKDPNRDVTVTAMKAGDTALTFGGIRVAAMPGPVAVALIPWQRVDPA
jgi:hypothetical protein